MTAMSANLSLSRAFGSDLAMGVSGGYYLRKRRERTI